MNTCILSRKSLLIPPGWKKDIDDVLTNDLLGANRYFAKGNPALKQHLVRQAGLDPTSFHCALVSRWNWHNTFFEDYLEPALKDILFKNVFSITPKRVELIARVYQTMSLIDQATLIPTAATKMHLEFWLDLYTRKMLLSDSEVGLLMTPERPAFWIEYLNDHLSYFAERNQEKKLLIRSWLLEKYHINDEEIFEGRLKKLSSFSSLGSASIRRKMKKLMKYRKDWSTRYYFFVERPQCRDLVKTIEFDNSDEYELLSTFIGISGFIFRKSVLDLLNRTKIIPNTGLIYEIDDNRVAKGLERLTEYRNQFMIKEVANFQQSSMDTCAPTCLMMVLHHFGLSKLGTEAEFAIYHQSQAGKTPGAHFSGLQKIADKMGLETVLTHSEVEMFKNNGYFDETLFRELLAAYKSHLTGLGKKAIVKNGEIIDGAYIRNLLEDDYLIILAGGKSILHAVLVVGYDKGGFVINDPLSTKREHWSIDKMLRFISTPIGSWALAIRKQGDSLKALEEVLPQFEGEARDFLK